MVKKLILISILLFAAVVILGCASQEKQEGVTTKVEVVPEETVAGQVVQQPKEVPVYQAPLDKAKFTRTCKTNDDCGKVRLMTGAGEVQDCINVNSEYETEDTDLCYCKLIGTTTQVLINGTELKSDNYECRHKA